MEFQILLGLLFTILPITELRVGLPIIIEYTTRNGISVLPYFFLVILLNILVIFFIFFFLDLFHNFAERKSLFYKRSFGWALRRSQKRIAKIKERFGLLQYFILLCWVAIPLPGTGAWTGTFIAWVVGLNRTKSIVAISLGVLIAGLIVLFASLGFFLLF